MDCTTGRGLSTISLLISVGVGGWIETGGGAVKSNSPSFPFSKQFCRFSKNLKIMNNLEIFGFFLTNEDLHGEQKFFPCL
jgi:hypothetical protein